MVPTFVGRDQELALLAEIRARAMAGRRQLVVVTGAAGIGKTWFCEEASSAADRDGFEVVWGRCWPHGGAPALWPWPAMLPALVGTAVDELLAADCGQERVDPERFARFTAVASMFADLRGRTPTMIVVDDVQHADESALLLTRFLTGTLDRLPLVVVLAMRTASTPNEAPSAALLAELRRDATTIALRPFDLTDTAALVAAHGQPAPDRATAETLLRVTGGSPLHLVHAVHRGWTGSGPATVEHAIADAIGRLLPRYQRILAFAALLGTNGAVSQVASLAEETSAVVLEALADACDAGLVELTPDGCRFHELVRQVAVDQLDTARLLDAHARAAALLSGTGRSEQVVQHALAAAVRSDADAEIAISACRVAAVALRRGYAYEPAADLLDRAVALAEHRSEQPAELLVERAEAVLACGRLTDAREAFEMAAGAAELAGDPVLVARAVLGLGGVWVHEHRHASVRQHVLARQRAALATLPEDERALRCRLAVRLAAEAAYAGGPVEPLLDALAATRALGDPRALADALSLTHHALLAPEHAARRLPLAEEQIAAASAAGDGILALFGLLWRTADLYILGDPDAERSLTELRQRSTALGVATVNYIVACMDVMRLIRAGRFEEAETAAMPCLQLGLEVGDADATGFYGAQLLAIRWLQGRDAELAELVSGVVASASLAVVEYGFRVSVVMVLARGGRMAEARAALEPLREHGLAALPRSSTWLSAMVGLVDAAWLLGDPTLATEVADLIRPFAERPVMPSLAVSCFGSAARALGRAALTMGDPDAAVTYLEQAVAANLRFDHRPAVALSRAELAEVLAARGRPGDPTLAKSMLAEAVDEARVLGMTRRVEMWTAQAAALDPPRTPARLTRHRDGWTVTGGASRIDLPDIVGLRYLSRLLESPGRELAAVDLSGAAVLTGRQELLDSAAVDAYRQRIRDLDAAIDDADADLGKAQRLMLEREAVAGELTRALGLGGRSREFSSTPERARTAVSKAIKRAIDAISERDPELGEGLRAAISTGTVCRYTPSGRPWRVDRE